MPQQSNHQLLHFSRVESSSQHVAVNKRLKFSRLDLPNPYLASCARFLLSVGRGSCWCEVGRRHQFQWEDLLTLFPVATYGADTADFVKQGIAATALGANSSPNNRATSLSANSTVTAPAAVHSSSTASLGYAPFTTVGNTTYYTCSSTGIAQASACSSSWTSWSSASGALTDFDQSRRPRNHDLEALTSFSGLD